MELGRLANNISTARPLPILFIFHRSFAGGTAERRGAWDRSAAKKQRDQENISLQQ
jgi:hypothetical protein